MESTQIMSFLREELIKQLIKETKLISAKGVQETLKDIFTNIFKGMLEAKLDNHLGYSDLILPRDIEGSFDLQVMKKNRNHILIVFDKFI
ncbi:transposase [Clostridium botulinum]|nr:transposase [Clostridium botulinum]